MAFVVALSAGCFAAAMSLNCWWFCENRERSWRAPTTIALFTAFVALVAYAGASV